MKEQLDYQSLPEILDNPVIYTEQELRDYTTELEATINDYNISGKDKDTGYHQAIQRLEMSKRGWMFVGVDSPKAQEQLHKLFGELGDGFSSVNRETDFDPNKESIEESRELLTKLPFVGEWTLAKPEAPDRFKIEGKVEIPLEAVIGAIGLESWAGRSSGHLKNGKPSIEVIREYASMGKYDGSAGLLDSRLVGGSDGRAYLYLEDAHRAAAAKLRGDKSIIVDSITLSSNPWECEI